jgi:hypothetical protein
VLLGGRAFLLSVAIPLIDKRANGGAVGRTRLLLGAFDIILHHRTPAGRRAKRAYLGRADKRSLY